MTERDIHPVAAIFPLMVGHEFHTLDVDIRENDLREPITLHPDGSILDGRNRHRACIMAKVEPKFVEWDGQGTPEAFVISKNLLRRHMSESQRAMAAAKLADMPQGARSDLRPIGAMSTADAAEVLNVGERSVTRAKSVRKSGNLKLVEAVETGTMSVAAAERKTRPSSPTVDGAAKLWLAWDQADNPARTRFIKKAVAAGHSGAAAERVEALARSNLNKRVGNLHRTDEAQLYAMQNQWLSANDSVRQRFGKWLEEHHDLKLIKLPSRKPKS